MCLSFVSTAPDAVASEATFETTSQAPPEKPPALLVCNEIRTVKTTVHDFFTETEKDDFALCIMTHSKRYLLKTNQKNCY